MLNIYLSSSFFMIVMLVILLVRIWFYIEWNKSKRYAVMFVGSVIVYVILDALFVRCFVDASVSRQAFRIIAFLFYLIYVIVPYIWHLFMENYMGIVITKFFKVLETLPLVFLLILVISSVATGSVWYFDSAGNYIRGPLFGAFAVLNLFYYFMAYIQTFCFLIDDKRKQVKYILEVSIFSAVPLMGIIVNTYVIPLYGVYPFQPYCLVVGGFLAYLFMVEHQKNKDATAHREQLAIALQQEKEASRKAREAGAVKDKFLANMSHDIRTPMNAILGFSNVIAQHPGDEAVVRDAVTKIQASGDVLMKIINDVLDLSRIESGKLQLEEASVNLPSIAAHLQMMLTYSIEKKSIHFEIQNQLQHPYVWCDTTKLQQILVNILNNAVKFTPEGGAVTLIMQEQPGNQDQSDYFFTVNDTGIGMDADFQAHAFEAFERERTTTESRIEGTGLGLAIVKRLVEFMKGTVTIRSQCGHGTEIEVVLHLRHAEAIQEPEEKVPLVMPDMAGQQALLVEDNELNAEIALEVLKKTGMKIDWVTDGLACMQRLEEAEDGDYQFILMDIQMPGLNGYDTTAKIRQMADPVKAGIPIVAMTANAFDEDRQRAYDAGMNGFITKPIEVDKMMQTIAAVYTQQRH